MQRGQVDYCHFENGAQESGTSLWTFKPEFGIIHPMNCSVCRSYMTHVAVANHSGDASFKDALNNRENRVSTAFLDGLQNGRQIQQEHDSPVPSRYRDERDKALQDLDVAKKEVAILRDRVLALELTVKDPISERESKRSDEETGSSTKSSVKSDMSSVERLLFSPSEDLDYGNTLSTHFLSTADKHDPPLIPNLPTAAGDREAPQTETPDPAKSLGSSPASIEPLAETGVSAENDAQSTTLLLKVSSLAAPEPVKATPEPVNPSPLPGSTSIKSWTQLTKTSSPATPKPEKSSPRQFTCALSLSTPSSDQRSSPIEPLGETDVSTATMPKSRAQLATTSSATPKPEKPSPQSSSCALGLSNPPCSDQQSSSVEPLGETNVSTTDVPKMSWAKLARPSSATPRSEKPSPQPSTYAPSLSNPSDQQSSSFLTSRSPRPLTTIAHLAATMKAAHSGDDSSLTRIRAFLGTARRTPRKQRTELQQYVMLHWRKPSPSVSSSVSSTGTGTVHTSLDNGMFSTEIHVDSSAWGIGFVMDGLWLAWKFSDSLTLSGNSIDNNWAEMLAVEVGLWTVIHWVCNVIQKEGDVTESLEIVVCSDNAGVVKAIEKRHSNFPPQQVILLRILDMVSEHDIQLSMRWISSMDNLADGPSRGIPGPAPDLLPFIPPLPSYLSDTLLMS